MEVCPHGKTELGAEVKRSSLDPPVVSLQVGIQGADHKFGAGSSNSEAIGAHSECGCYDFSVIGKITFENKKDYQPTYFEKKQAIIPEGQSDLHVIDGTGADIRYQCAILELEAWVRCIVRNDANLTKAIKKGVSNKGRTGRNKSNTYARPSRGAGAPGSLKTVTAESALSWFSSMKNTTPLGCGLLPVVGIGTEVIIYPGATPDNLAGGPYLNVLSAGLLYGTNVNI